MGCGTILQPGISTGVDTSLGRLSLTVEVGSWKLALYMRNSRNPENDRCSVGLGEALFWTAIILRKPG